MIIDFNTHCNDETIPDTQADIDLTVVSHLNSAFDTAKWGNNRQTSSDRSIPFFSLNPGSDVERVPVESKGIRIYPTYQTWEAVTWQNLLEYAQQKRWIVQIYLRLMDPRAMRQANPFYVVIDALKEAITSQQDINFVISGIALAEIRQNVDLFKLENVWTEISHIQHPVGSLEKTADLLGTDRLIFGTNFPFFYPYAGIYRVMNSKISDEDRESILHSNAEALLIA